MKKAILLVTLFCSIGFARELVALKECEAYNNLKHTKNSMHSVVNSGQTYQILREHKNNYLVKVKDANPRTRWVDVDCFSKNSKNNDDTKKPLVSNNNLDTILVVSWHNSFCENHSNKKECKRLGADAKNHLVLHGLWPQPRNNVYCNVDYRLKQLDKMKRWSALPKLDLSKDTQELMQQYMPGYQSSLQRHEWIKHGTCYKANPDIYFQKALKFTKKLDDTIGKYLRENLGKRVNLYNLKKVAKKSIYQDIDSKIALKCKGRVISEIWLSLHGSGDNLKDLIKNSKPIRSNCTNAIVDKAGKFRR